MKDQTLGVISSDNCFSSYQSEVHFVTEEQVIKVYMHGDDAFYGGCCSAAVIFIKMFSSQCLFIRG